MEERWCNVAACDCAANALLADGSTSWPMVAARVLLGSRCEGGMHREKADARCQDLIRWVIAPPDRAQG